jgi:hypothetical protein
VGEHGVEQEHPETPLELLFDSVSGFMHARATAVRVPASVG